jgi:hypothetical protein
MPCNIEHHTSHCGIPYACIFPMLDRVANLKCHASPMIETTDQGKSQACTTASTFSFLKEQRQQQLQRTLTISNPKHPTSALQFRRDGRPRTVSYDQCNGAKCNCSRQQPRHHNKPGRVPVYASMIITAQGVVQVQRVPIDWVSFRCVPRGFKQLTFGDVMLWDIRTVLGALEDVLRSTSKHHHYHYAGVD